MLFNRLARSSQAQNAFRFQSSKAAQTPASAGGGSGGAGLLTSVMFAAVGSAGFVAGLKSSPEFRAQVEAKAPFVTDVLRAYIDLDAPVFPTKGKAESLPPRVQVEHQPAEAQSKPKKEDKTESTPKIAEPETTIDETPVQSSAPVLEVSDPEPVPVVVKSVEDDLKDISNKSETLWLRSVEGAMTEVMAQSLALRRELQESKLKGIDSMDAVGLRQKVIELVEQQQERSKWEALRLHTTLQKVEQDTAAKYNDLLQQQTDKHEELISREKRLVQEMMERQLRESLEQQTRDNAAQQESLLQEQANQNQEQTEQQLRDQRENLEQAFSDKLKDEVAKAENKRLQDYKERIAVINSLSQTVKALERVFDNNSEDNRLSHITHKVNAAYTELKNCASDAKPFVEALTRLKTHSDDTLIGEVMKSTDTDVSSAGVRTQQQLNSRFKAVRRAGRRAAYVPEDSPGLIGYALGFVTAALIWPARGLQQGKHPEACLARAAHYLDKGDLAASVREVSQLEGRVGDAVSDWLSDAQSRLLLDQNLKMLDAHMACLAESFL